MSRIEVFKNFTKELATLSKCSERKVAAIITDRSYTQIHSIGLNGGPKNLTNCLCLIEGKYGCIHAELNALIKCVDTSPRKVMFITLAPCKQCAAAIINAPGGFELVYYFEDWKDNVGLKLLQAAGIMTIKI